MSPGVTIDNPLALGVVHGGGGADAAEDAASDDAVATMATAAASALAAAALASTAVAALIFTIRPSVLHWHKFHVTVVLVHIFSVTMLVVTAV